MFRTASSSTARLATGMVAAPSGLVAVGPQLQFRGIMVDRAKTGLLCLLDKKLWRLNSVSKSQKGQGAAAFNIKLTELGGTRKKDMNSLPQSYDLPEVRYERVKLLFSGYDDDDNACFVYPQHSANAGEEVNIPATKLSEQHQQFLAVGMPVDIMHIGADEEMGISELWTDVNVPTSYEYTVENLRMKGMYKMAVLKECDGLVSVTDNIQPGDKIKVTIRPDGKCSFGQSTFHSTDF